MIQTLLKASIEVGVKGTIWVCLFTLTAMTQAKYFIERNENLACLLLKEFMYQAFILQLDQRVQNLATMENLEGKNGTP